MILYLTLYLIKAFAATGCFVKHQDKINLFCSIILLCSSVYLDHHTIYLLFERLNVLCFLVADFDFKTHHHHYLSYFVAETHYPSHLSSHRILFMFVFQQLFPF